MHTDCHLLDLNLLWSNLKLWSFYTTFLYMKGLFPTWMFENDFKSWNSLTDKRLNFSVNNSAFKSIIDLCFFIHKKFSFQENFTHFGSIYTKIFSGKIFCFCVFELFVPLGFILLKNLFLLCCILLKYYFLLGCIKQF